MLSLNRVQGAKHHEPEKKLKREKKESGMRMKIIQVTDPEISRRTHLAHLRDDDRGDEASFPNWDAHSGFHVLPYLLGCFSTEEDQVPTYMRMMMDGDDGEDLAT